MFDVNFIARIPGLSIESSMYAFRIGCLIKSPTPPEAFWASLWIRVRLNPIHLYDSTSITSFSFKCVSFRLYISASISRYCTWSSYNKRLEINYYLMQNVALFDIFLYFCWILLHYYCIFLDLYLISGHFYSICFVSILYSLICIHYPFILLYYFRLYCMFSHLHCIFLDLCLISRHFYSISLHYYFIFLDLYLISGHFYYICFVPVLWFVFNIRFFLSFFFCIIFVYIVYSVIFIVYFWICI